MFRHSTVVCLMVLLCCGDMLRADCDPCDAVETCSPNDNGKAIEIGAVYTGGVFSNLRGGERTGTTYVGVAEIGITGDSEKLGLWKNGTFFVGGLFSHGQGITRYVGDYQDPVAFAYETPAKLVEYWYAHRFLRDRLTVKIGQQDTCSMFFYVDSKADFINASFTCPPATCMPTQPHSTRGIATSLDLWNDITFKFGIHDADHNMQDHWGRDLHYDMQIERRYSLFNALPGFVFLGGWYDTSECDHYHKSQEHKIHGTTHGNYGFCAGIDQTVWLKNPCRYTGRGTQKTTVFAQFGTYKKDRDDLRFYYDIGLTHRGFLRSRPDDLIGIACTTVCFSPGYRVENDDLLYKYESAYELFYKFQLSERAILQPNFQYIVHPGGQYADSTLLGLFFQVTL